MEEPQDLVELVMAQQPTRRGKHRPPRRFDKTQLKAAHQGRLVSRDYAAHFFRWGWVTRHIQPGTRLLDVGCGQDLPLMHVLSYRIGTQPSYYLGVDLNKIESYSRVQWATVLDEFSFVDRFKELPTQEPFDIATNFEVIEHMGVEDGKILLEGIYYWLKPGGYLYLSTPVFDGKAAKNHVHEYTIPELQRLVEAVGFQVEKRWGTFANVPALKKVAAPDELAVLERLSRYYSYDILSTFLAPLYPDASRNNLWVLRRP